MSGGESPKSDQKVVAAREEVARAAHSHPHQGASLPGALGPARSH